MNPGGLTSEAPLSAEVGKESASLGKCPKCPESTLNVSGTKGKQILQILADTATSPLKSVFLSSRVKKMGGHTTAENKGGIS